MINKSIRYILIVTVLALFVAVFISSHESELNLENLVKKKTGKGVSVTIKKPTTKKSKVVKLSVKTSAAFSAKVKKSGGSSVIKI